MQRPDTGFFSSKQRYLAVVAGLLAACLFAGALFRNQAQPVQFPLTQLSTYNPGASVFRTWWDWSPMSTGDLLPVFDAAQGRSTHADYRMYRPHELEEHKSAFVYTPLAALILSPIAQPGDSFEDAARTVGIANHLLALAGLGALFAFFFRGSARPTSLVLFAVHAIAFYPLAKALELTQVGVWIFFLLAAALFLFDRGARVASGLALALAVSIKPHLVLVPLILLLAKNFSRRFLYSCLAGLVVLGGISLAYAGFDNLRDYVLVLLPHLSSGYAYAPNQSFNGMLLRLFTDADPAVFNLAAPVQWIKLAGNAFVLALVAITILVGRKRAQPGSSESDIRFLGVAISAVVLASPVCWIHHYALLAIPLAATGRALVRDPRLGRGGADIAFVAGAVLLSFFFDASRAPALLTGLEFYGALLMLITSMCLIRRESE